MACAATIMAATPATASTTSGSATTDGHQAISSYNVLQDNFYKGRVSLYRWNAIRHLREVLVPVALHQREPQAPFSSTAPPGAHASPETSSPV